MIHKLFHLCEAGFILMFLNIQPFFGALSAIAAATYYIAMLKTNVVNKNHEGSWRKFFKSIIKRK
jgi:hypothetical protein